MNTKIQEEWLEKNENPQNNQVNNLIDKNGNENGNKDENNGANSGNMLNLEHEMNQMDISN